MVGLGLIRLVRDPVVFLAAGMIVWPNNDPQRPPIRAQWHESASVKVVPSCEWRQDDKKTTVDIYGLMCRSGN